MKNQRMNKIRQYYDGISKGYDELYGEEQLKKVKFIVEEFKEVFEQKKKILDAGAGTGILNKFLKNKDLISLDISPKMLEKNKNDKKIIGSITKMPFKNKEFDLVFCITVLQDLNENEIEKAIKEIKRTSKNAIISFLKKSSKKETIIKFLKKFAKIEKIVELEKDIVLFATL